MQDLGETAGVRADLTREVDALHRDVAQLDRLLGDAVVRLTRSFESIASVTTVGDAAWDHGDAMTATSIATDVNDALTALQFHDIASQLLRKVDARLDLVDRLGRYGPAVVDGQADADAAHESFLRTEIAQTTLAVGTAELF